MKPTAEFNVRKAAQAAAFFALKHGGDINVLKLVKLLYLADRDHLAKYDVPILFDFPFSMDHGPVDSITYDLICGVSESAAWDEFITRRAANSVGAAKKLDSSDMDQLSRANVLSLESVWSEFGKYDQWWLVDYVHKKCAEWEDPHGSSVPIPYARIFKALGKEDTQMLDQEIKQERMVGRLFATL